MSSGLPSGTYTITNVLYSNRASLTKGDDEEIVSCKLPHPECVGQKWRFTRYPGDRYSIRNEEHQLHVMTQTNAAEAALVYGVRDDISMAWTIKECEDYGSDVYNIYAEGFSNLVWTIDDCRNGAPVRRNVECAWKGLSSPGMILHFQEPLSLLYRGEEVAEMTVPGNGMFVTETERIRMHFHPKDNTQFQAFAAAVLIDCDVQARLRIKKYKLYHSNPSEQGSAQDRDYVFCHGWVKEVRFKGLHSFRECITLKNLRMLGSASDSRTHEPYINAAIDVHIMNMGCLLTFSGDAVISIYYGNTKAFTIGPNVDTYRGVRWKSRPMSPANDELRSFMDRWVMTQLSLPVKLVVDTISTTVCGSLVNLPPFSIDTQIEGFGIGIVTSVDVHISPKVLITRGLSFEFTMDNPFDTTLELKSMQLQVSIRGSHVATVRHTFSGVNGDRHGRFVIPARGKGKSPKISHCWLNAGYIKSFQLAISRKAPLDVFVESADIVYVLHSFLTRLIQLRSSRSVDKYHLDGLTYDPHNIPFRLHAL
ncbi:uncharacterized protein B0H18DRAFT_909565 [Fomitopsis serialis]|uniref:uncharacterized protein n=1 Tax=Fomitopsis serialis TaxID=139415 RepID=UPI00200870F0|nr:uncharacterized protein B0H18DRAFT_909565 [Neoantrodia serialis]KAH9923826.1 hypothetical protein B0H18DRAFT_909565 [Neoantrodia serialis]